MTRAYLGNRRGWPVATLEPDRNGGVIVAAASGSTPETEIGSNWGGPIPWLTPKEITDSSTSYRLIGATERTLTASGARGAGRIWEPRTVMLTKRAPVGGVVINTVPMTTNQGFLNFRCGVNLLPEYFYHWLKANKPYLDAVANGSTYPELYVSDLFEFDISLPPLGQQTAIASFLSAFDDKIELNRRMNETLEAMARAIFKDWFVEFGPTRAKMEGRAPYLAPEIWSLFPDLLDNEGKPQGWPLGRLDDLLVLQRGFDLPSSVRQPGNFVVMAASGPNGFHNEFMVRGPGITTGRSGVLGRVFFIMEDFWPLNTSLWVKEFRASSPLHAFFLLRTLDFAAFNAGSAVPTLNRNHVHSLPMPVPPKGLVDTFDASGMPLMRNIRANEVQSETLAATRDLLLPKLMSGEIRVKDAEKIVEAAK